jgi:hypothetical protein
VTDDRVLDYLRSRGQAAPPAELVASVMAAIGEAPEPRSRFSALLPALAAAGAVAVVVVLALLVGQGRDVGPEPSGTPDPSATASPDAEPSVEALRDALADAVEVLRAAPGVEGRQVSARDGVIGTATWFDWRPNGDAVVVQRQDLDVTETGWWIVPGGDPPPRAGQIRTLIWVIAGDRFFFANEDGDGWQVADRQDAPRVVAYGPGILDGVIEPWQPLEGLVQRLPDPTAARVTRDDLPDGGVEWLVETDWRDGTAIQRWTIDPDGALRSWTWRLVDVAVDVEGGFNANATFASLIFRIAEGDPIELPDADAEPDAAALGVPPDLPLEPPPASLDLVEQVDTCEHPSGRYRVTLPDGWWTNRGSDGDDSSLWQACELFGPEPFNLSLPAEGNWHNGVALTIDWIDGGCIGSFTPLLSSDETTVDGLPASVGEFARGLNPDDPPGYYQYVIDLSEPGVDCEVGGRFVTAMTSVEMTGEYEENKAFLDQIMEGMQISPP